MKSPQSISIFGLGYVGLCTAFSFAQQGFHVIGVDIDEDKINTIKKGEPPIHEPSLETALKDSQTQSRLTLMTDHKEAIEKSEVSFITVGTPNQPDGKIDLKYITLISTEIGNALRDKSEYHLVVVKSTVVPGTTENTIKPIIERTSGKRCGVDFGLCVNPEFLSEGNALEDTLNPDRIIIGEHDERSGETRMDLYKTFHHGHIPPMMRTNLPTAEIIKYTNNAFLATKISFINTIANICEKISGVDVSDIADAVGLDHRVSPHFLRAGLGYGGSCFPKDLKAFIAYSNTLNYQPELLEAIEKVNNLQFLRAVEMAEELIGSLQGRRIAILGLAFKPDTDDMREAVSIKIIDNLLEKGAVIQAYDPAALENAKKIFRSKISYCETLDKCIEDADCTIIVTEWDEFRLLGPEKLIEKMRPPALVDGRKVTDPKKFRDRVKYAAIGLRL